MTYSQYFNFEVNLKSACLDDQNMSLKSPTVRHQNLTNPMQFPGSDFGPECLYTPIRKEPIDKHSKTGLLALEDNVNAQCKISQICMETRDLKTSRS